MKKLIWVVTMSAALIACQENETENNEFTGNETTYALLAGSEYDVNGTVNIKEKTDGTALISVTLSGTEGNIELPVHLHLGTLATPGADVYALLNPVIAKTGKSETLLTTVADESTLSYQQLKNLKACLKVHLAASGPDKDIVLAGGNIGAAVSDDLSNGRAGFAVCKSE